jgi:predicted phage terminase large subunit-like protein
VGVRGAYLIDVWRDRVAYPQLLAAASALAERWHPGEILIEDKGSGQSMIQSLRSGTMLPVIAVPVMRGDGKRVRAEAITPYIEAGRVFVPEWALWLGEYLRELAAFPFDSHDDQVDSTSQALSRIFGQHIGGRRVSRSYLDDPGESWG